MNRVFRLLEETNFKTHMSKAQSWLQEECGVDEAGAAQIVAYVQSGIQVLGAVPTQQRIIAERFFDEAGGMQLVIHSPFGGRLNRAWGLALRKRFCLNFDFELQAAATDEGLVLSLGEKHSFPLDAIFSFLNSKTVRDVLIQALLASPLFVTRWRWNISRSSGSATVSKRQESTAPYPTYACGRSLGSGLPHGDSLSGQSCR